MPSMDGTEIAAIAIGVRAATAAMAFPLGYLDSATGAMESLWWVCALALAGAACLVTKWWRSYGGRALWHSLPIQRWPDFKHWDDRTEFELYEAAALWFDTEPRLPMWWRARRKFRRWGPMIATGVIVAEPALTAGIAAPTISSITPHT